MTFEQLYNSGLKINFFWENPKCYKFRILKLEIIFNLFLLSHFSLSLPLFLSSSPMPPYHHTATVKAEVAHFMLENSQAVKDQPPQFFLPLGKLHYWLVLDTLTPQFYRLQLWIILILAGITVGNMHCQHRVGLAFGQGQNLSCRHYFLHAWWFPPWLTIFLTFFNFMAVNIRRKQPHFPIFSYGQQFKHNINFGREPWLSSSTLSAIVLAHLKV